VAIATQKALEARFLQCCCQNQLQVSASRGLASLDADRMIPELEGSVEAAKDAND